MNTVILILFFVGMGFIGYSVIKFKPVEQAPLGDSAEETLDKLASTVTDADNAIEELNKLSLNIFDEMSGKYKDLLYLYSLVDQKHQEIKALGANSIAPTGQSAPPPLQYGPYTDSLDKESFMDMFHASGSNQKHVEIRALGKQGLTVAQIAKKLNLGQGEVSLVLDLDKSR